jgi:hypothetical protein
MVYDTIRPALIIVSANDIAKRAYQIYQDRGYADGFDVEDWLRAKRELRNPHSRLARTGSRRLGPESVQSAGVTRTPTRGGTPATTERAHRVHALQAKPPPGPELTARSRRRSPASP